MTLRKKFNRGLLFAFAVGLSLAGYFTWDLLQRNAEAEVLTKAGLMMEAGLAIRDYTVSEVRPLLADKMEEKDLFFPQTIPAYAATTNFHRLNKHKEYEQYRYKEATLNPTNPIDRPADWERDIIERFRREPELKRHVSRRVDVDGNTQLSLSRPITITNEECLACHGDPDDAPAPMLEKYGRANGFGWKLGETVGAQIVTVPMSLPMARAQNTFLLFMGSLLAIFVVIFVLLNILLHMIVIRPVVRMARIANDVSMGKPDVPEFNKPGDDEIASLSESFNRMRRSMDNALTMLEEQ